MGGALPRGDRLCLAPMDLESAEVHSRWALWMADAEVARQYGGKSRPITIDEARETVTGLKGHRFALIRIEFGDWIGCGSVHDVDPVNRNAFIGLFVGDAANRGKGYGGEAVRLLLEFAFGELGLNCVALSVRADNAPAIACYRKAGFRDAGRRREWIAEGEGYVDRLYMDILSREFRALWGGAEGD